MTISNNYPKLQANMEFKKDYFLYFNPGEIHLDKSIIPYFGNPLDRSPLSPWRECTKPRFMPNFDFLEPFLSAQK